MVEAVGRAPLEVERADQAAEVVRALEERDVHALLEQPVGGGEPEDPAADDADRGPCCRHLGRRSPPAASAAAEEAPVAGERRADRHLALADTARAVEVDGDLLDPGAERRDLREQLRLAGEAGLGDELVSVTPARLTEHRRAVDAEEGRDRARVEAEQQPHGRAGAPAEEAADEADVDHLPAAVHRGEHEARAGVDVAEHRVERVEIARRVRLERDHVRVVVAHGERRVESGAERCARTAVLTVRHELRRDGPVVARHPLPRAVARPVVDDEELAPLGKQLRPALEILEQPRQVLDLVERGDDEEVRDPALTRVLATACLLARGVVSAQFPCACDGTHASDLPLPSSPSAAQLPPTATLGTRGRRR